MSLYYREMSGAAGRRIIQSRPAHFDHRVDVVPDAVKALHPLAVPLHEEDFDQYLEDLRATNPALYSSDRRTRLQAERELRRAESFHHAHYVDALMGKGTRYNIKQEIEESLEPRADRVAAERALADYIHDIAAARPVDAIAYRLGELSYSLMFCHHSGCLGLRPGGERVIAWDHKCEKVRLCPHESREETQRIAEIYCTAIDEEMQRDPSLRIFYAVVNPRNIPEGELKEGKRELFRRTSAWLKDETESSPLIMNPRSGQWIHTKPFSMAGSVQGALVVQEDPLSGGAGWNVHQNCLLIVKGQFEFKLAHQLWKNLYGVASIDFQPVKKENLIHAVIEIVKYSTRTVPEKSGDKAGNSPAPAMTEWPHVLWLEWWQAQQRFRRTRSYGSIYAVERRRWNTCEPQERYDRFLTQARLRGHDLPLEYVDMDWCSIPEKDRGILRDVMRKPEVFSLDDVMWCGRVDYMDCLRGYWVDVSAPYLNKWVVLIPGYNFSDSGGKNNFQSGAPPGNSGPSLGVH